MPSSRSPRKPSAHRQRALERRVARLERLIAQPKPEPVLPSYPGPFSGWQRCPLCGTLYTGVHACWTWNPHYWQPSYGSVTAPKLDSLPIGSLNSTGIDLSATTTTINAQTWANNEGSGGHLH